MDRQRLEAFTDGVIAVVITIMVLELTVPSGSSFSSLRSVVPVFLAYVLTQLTARPRGGQRSEKPDVARALLAGDSAGVPAAVDRHHALRKERVAMVHPRPPDRIGHARNPVTTANLCGSVS
jgi:hypothetical protein